MSLQLQVAFKNKITREKINNIENHKNELLSCQKMKERKTTMKL